ncbi:MAG: hypothetical protein HFH14_04365 [Lachnospiraceae bacterium]|nr:hypothetical protein [Lachnospiraceae bacterium]
MSQAIGIERESETEFGRCNRVAVICHTIEVAIIILAYFVEFFKGARTFPYVVAVLAIGIAAPAAEIVLLCKDRNNRLIKYILSVGFGIFYTFVALTTVNKLAFVYAVPMLIVITVYNDTIYSIISNSLAVVINIIQVVMFLGNGVYTMEDSASIEIQILVMIIIGVFSAYVSKTTEYNARINLEKIRMHGQESEKMLAQTLEVSDGMVSTIEKVANKILDLDRTISATKDAMEELSTGSNDTTDAVQRQLGLTENIQTKVSGVENGMGEIVDSVKNTNNAIKDGRDNVEKLVEKGNESMLSGKKVEEELTALSKDMQELNSVIDIINNITSQTELLSFNASIEAARAGETGRGFAVVASEISKMAGETDVATNQITDKLSHITETINRVVKVTNNMIDIIESQNEATIATADSFKVIENNTADISAHSRKLEVYVKELAGANTEIVESISTISSISEEVTAHASQTYSASEDNMGIVKDVVEHISELRELADKLK